MAERDAADPPAEGGGRSREEEVLRARRESLGRLGARAFAISLQEALGVTEPVSVRSIREAHGGLEPDRRTEERVTVAGRVILSRDLGRLRFLTLRDGSGGLQLVCDRSTLDDAAFSDLDEVDLGDIVGATGVVGTTRRGELSVFVERWAMLTKSLRPLPEKWHGLRDPDLQQRRRYLHLIADETPRRYALARAAVLRALRAVLEERGFLEFEGPILQSVAGGANAKPFTTFHDALDVEMKLRISLELYLKRMLVGGFERVYELGRNFRNEGIDRDHNPEFTMLEAYQAYGDYTTMMELSEELVRAAAWATNPVMGRPPDDLTVSSRGRTIDLAPPFRRRAILDLVSEATGEDVTLDRPDLWRVAEGHGVPVDEMWGPGQVVQELFEKLVEDEIVEPTFVCDFPREVSPLARPHRTDPGLTEHFDLVIGGIELVTAFSELTDPIEQRERFALQQRLRAAGVEETHPLDEDFLRALEHGMPPAGGLGLGIDRLLMLLTDAPSLRDLIMFPAHRPEAGRRAAASAAAPEQPAAAAERAQVDQRPEHHEDEADPT